MTRASFKLLIAVGLLSAVTPCARADLLDDVIQRYATAGPAIESRCCKGTYSATRSQTGKGGEFTVDDTLTVRVRGDRFTVVSQINRSASANLPVGSVWVCGGSRKDYFSALKLAGRADFAISSFGADSYAVAKFRNQALAAVAPFAVTGMTIGDLFTTGKFTPVSAERASAGGQAVIVVTFRPHDSSYSTKAVRITLLADSLCLLSYDVELPATHLRGENQYSSAGPNPQLKQAETWTQRTEGGHGGTDRLKGQKIVIQSFKAETIPDGELTPQSVGVTETPASISPPRD